MTVVAACVDCGHEHPLAHRDRGEVTTLCPRCESPRYHTRLTNGGVFDETQLIRDTVTAVDGVGGATAEHFTARYDAYAELEAASVDELCEIPNVGPTTAERIASAV